MAWRWLLRTESRLLTAVVNIRRLFPRKAGFAKCRKSPTSSVGDEKELWAHKDRAPREPMPWCLFGIKWFDP